MIGDVGGARLLVDVRVFLIQSMISWANSSKGDRDLGEGDEWPQIISRQENVSPEFQEYLAMQQTILRIDAEDYIQDLIGIGYGINKE